MWSLIKKKFKIIQDNKNLRQNLLLVQGFAKINYDNTKTINCFFGGFNFFFL